MPVLIQRSFSNNNNFSFSASFALSSGVKEISLNSLTHRFVNVTFQRKRRYSLDYIIYLRFMRLFILVLRNLDVLD